MTGLLLTIGVALFVLLCLVLRAARGVWRRNHERSVQDAILAMMRALESESPQQALLREILALLTEQDQMALALEERIHGLLPELADPGRGSGAPGCLDAVSGLVAEVRRASWVLPEIEAHVMQLLKLPEPREVVSSYVASTFDFSRDALARAQFIHVRDHAGQVPDSLVLSAAVGSYGAEIAGEGMARFTADASEYTGRSAELQAVGSTMRAAAGVFREGLPPIPSYADPRPDSERSPGSLEPGGPGSAVGAQQGRPAAGLAMRDVFDSTPGTTWWHTFGAYLPVFAFVAEDIHALSALDKAWARVRTRVQNLHNDLAQAAPTAPEAEPIALWPGAHGSSAEVISKIIGPKIATIVRARWLTWCAWDCHRVLAGVLTTADAAAKRLVSGIRTGLARERAAYLARIGRVPRLDTVADGIMACVATDIHEESLENVRLAWALLADGEAIRRAEGGGQPTDTVRLAAALSAADEALHKGQAAIASGSYLDGARHVLDARLPLQSDGFPGRVFHQGLLAQARPLAVLAITHRMAVARWAALALVGYFRARELAEEMISGHVTEYARAHEEIVLAANSSITGIGRVAAR